MTEIMTCSETVMMNPLDLIPNPRNAVFHPPEQIASLVRGFKRYGFIGSITIGTDDMIIAGHGRVIAAIECGMEEIPCVRVAHLTLDEQDALMLADNGTSEMKIWNDELKESEISRLIDLDFDFEEIGMFADDAMKEINSILRPTAVPEHFERHDGEVSPDKDFDTDEQRDRDLDPDNLDTVNRSEHVDIKEPVEPAKAKRGFQTTCPECDHQFIAMKQACDKS